MAELRFGPDGYLDLSDLPDGDPDTVLPADELAALHDALAGAHPEIDDDRWDGLVHAVVTDDGADDLVAVAVPGADGGPFALDDWAAAADHHDATLVGPDDDQDHDPADHDLPDDQDHDPDLPDLLEDLDHDIGGMFEDVLDDVEDGFVADLDPDDDHDPSVPDGDDAFVPEEDEHYDF
jgi:hypothetical protein